MAWADPVLDKQLEAATEAVETYLSQPDNEPNEQAKLIALAVREAGLRIAKAIQMK